MIRRPPRSTQGVSSAASDVYKRQLVKRLRKKLNVVEDGAGNCIVSVRDIGYKFELNNENEQQ